MDPKSTGLWILGAINILAILIDNLVKIITGGHALKKYRVPIFGAMLFVTGVCAGALWERRLAYREYDFRVQQQIVASNLEQKYESLLEASSCRQNTPKAMLYEDAKKDGRRLCFTLGAYPDLRAFAFNDLTSSISLAGDVKAVAYEDIDYGGRSLLLDHNVDALSADWNDKISSLKVCRKADLSCN